MNSHRNVVFNSQAYRDWMSLTPDDVVLAVAPLFHITGLIAGLTVSLLVPMKIVLGYRFDPKVVLDLIEQHRPTFTVGAITVFIALMNDPSREGRDLSSLTKVYSGGAPIAPVVVERFQSEIGAVHPQHLRPDRDHLAVARRAHDEGRPGRPDVRRPVGGRADLQHRRARRGRRGQGRPRRRGRRVRDVGPAGRVRLLAEAGGDGPRHPRRRAAHRRRRVHGRGRLVLRRRPQEGHDQRVGLQGVATRGRGRALPAQLRCGRRPSSACPTSTGARR